MKFMKEGWSGFGENLDSLTPKGYFGHTEEGLPRKEFDLKKGEELLAEAGYPNGLKVNLDTWNSMLYPPSPKSEKIFHRHRNFARICSIFPRA